MKGKKPYPKPKRERHCKHPTATHRDPRLNSSLQTRALQTALVASELDLAKEQAGNISLSVFKAIQL